MNKLLANANTNSSVGLRGWAGSWAEGISLHFGAVKMEIIFSSYWHEIDSGLNLRESY